MLENREMAGDALGRMLENYRGEPGVLILALPRGGVVVGSALSRRLNLPLDVLISMKIPAPWDPELALGAVTETGFILVNDEIVESSRLPADYLQSEIRRLEREVAHRRDLYRGGRDLPSLLGKTVILADDGIATGASYLAAIESLRHRTGRIVAAAPVAALSTISKLSQAADEVCVLEAPDHLESISTFYKDFLPVSQEEVLSRLSFRQGRTGLRRRSTSPA